MSNGAHVAPRQIGGAGRRIPSCGAGEGGSDDGAPGEREHDGEGQGYHAAFVRDPDGNRIEAVTFIPR